MTCFNLYYELRRKLFLCILASVITSPSLPAQQLFDLAKDFSPVQNPNAVWSFGWMSADTENFNLYTNSVAAYELPLREWRGPFRNDNGTAPPDVILNPTDDPITVSDTTWLPQQVTFHPGENGERSVVRWTSPQTVNATVMAEFEGRSGFVTSGVEVLHNGAVLFSNTVWGAGTASRVSFISNLLVQAGNTIDFRVNYGNGNWASDTTQIGVVIQAVPQPTLTLTLLTSSSIRLTWPTNAQGYLLETATQLPLAQWMPVTNQPLQLSNDLTILLVATNQSQFFRLRKP